MNLQGYLVKAFESWRPESPEILERTKCSITLNWNHRGRFNFIADQFLYKLERNNKIPRWIVEYSGGKTTKLIDYLAPRHPHRFRLRVILKATAVSTLAERALKHYGDAATVYNSFKYILATSDFKDDTDNTIGKKEETSSEVVKNVSEDKTIGDFAEKRERQKDPKRSWLESQWSNETWTSTDTDGTSAVCFCMAVRCGYIKQVQVMVEERPALVGIANSSNGFTPLAVAVRRGDVNMAKFLISAGAEVDQPSFAGQTALHLAVLTKQPNMIELLLEKGADFKKRDINGLQVEHYAVDSCDVDTLGLVLDRGGDVGARDAHGWTPLFRALCQDASIEMVTELVARGSDLGLKDHAGLPLTSVARLLKNRLGRERASLLRLVDVHYPHEKALANFTRLTKKLHSVRSILK